MNLLSQLARLSAYLADNLVCAASSTIPNCIYDDKPLGFENSLLKDNTKKIEVQDPLEEINLGDDDDKIPTFISKLLSDNFRSALIVLLKEYKDCFACDYHEMPCLSRNLVEHRLPMK